MSTRSPRPRRKESSPSSSLEGADAEQEYREKLHDLLSTMAEVSMKRRGDDVLVRSDFRDACCDMIRIARDDWRDWLRKGLGSLLLFLGGGVLTYGVNLLTQQDSVPSLRLVFIPLGVVLAGIGIVLLYVRMGK